MDFLNYLRISASEINSEMERFFRNWSGEVGGVSPKLVTLNQAFIQASEGGKRLRGTLVKLGYELTGEKFTSEILKPAAAFEIFQTAILAHDDVIDQSPLRRNKPTLYCALGGNQYAISQTICLGDIGYFVAMRMIGQSHFPDKNKAQALSLFAQAMLETALGQMLDIELPYRQESKDETDTLTVFRLKTARYTISGPLHLGVILGGGDQKLLDDISRFGESLGIAFQIQDDILGVFGDEKTLGKSVTSDIEEGKNTLLIIHALKHASPKQKQILDKYYGRGLPACLPTGKAGRQEKIGEKELDQIRRVFIDTGALEYSQKKEEELVKKAQNVIEQMEVSLEHKKLLSQMANFLVKRDK